MVRVVYRLWNITHLNFSFDRPMKYSIVTIVGLFLVASVAQANGFGLKFDQTVGDYILNVDTDAYTITTGDPVRFSFTLWNKDRTEAVDTDNVWVTIAPQGSRGILFAGQLNGKPNFGGTGMSYAFSKPGTYTLSARFQNTDDTGDHSLAEASFLLTVEDASGADASKQSNIHDAVSWGILGLVVGAVSMFFLRKSHKP